MYPLGFINGPLIAHRKMRKIFLVTSEEEEKWSTSLYFLNTQWIYAELNLLGEK